MADVQPPDLSTSATAGVNLLTDPAAIADTGSALDALFAVAVPDAEKVEADKAAADAAAEKAATEKAAADAALTPDQKAAADKAVADKSAADAAAAEAAVPVKDAFDAVELPPHSKPATAQSFEALKKTAREKVAAAEKEREEYKAKLAEAQAKPALDPAIEKELTELREFRQKLDVEADPAFKEYTDEIAVNEESIFSKLKEAGSSEAVIAKIKEIGIKDLDWETVLDKLPPVARRYIENKLATNEDLSEQRTRAINEAKKNSSEFLAEREKKNTQSEIAHFAEAEANFNKLAPQLPWFKVEKIDPAATPEDKASLEAHNKFVAQTQKAVKEMLSDNSPNMRAIATLGYAQMLRLQAEIPMLQAEHEAEKKALASEVAALKAQVKEKEDFIARVKRSSTTSLREGSAPTDPKATAKQPTFGEHGSTALDRLREEQVAGQ
jgi:hypothetical protein